MSERKPPSHGEPAWISMRYGFLVILVGGIIVSGVQLLMGSAPEWNSTGPAFMTVGAVGVIASFIIPLFVRRAENDEHGE